MLSLPDVQDVFVADDILVHMHAGGTLALEDIQKRLAKLEIEVSKISEDKKRLLE